MEKRKCGALFPQCDQQHPAHDHRRAKHDSRGHALDVAQKQRAENEREKRTGAADRNDNGYLPPVERVVDARHAEADRCAREAWLFSLSEPALNDVSS